MIHRLEMRTQVLILQQVWRGLKNLVLVTSAAAAAAEDTGWKYIMEIFKKVVGKRRADSRRRLTKLIQYTRGERRFD